VRVILEIGKKRKVVAGAVDWPGLDRSGSSEERAIDTMTSYRSRYAGVAERAGLASAFSRDGAVEVVERVPGSSSTDFWGVAHIPSEFERDVLSTADLERRLGLLQACWDYFDDVAARVSKDLRPGKRGGGRSREQIIPHVYASERHNYWRKVGIREDDEIRLTPEELAAHRTVFVAAIRAYNAEGKPARSYPIQFLLRRTAQHAMDHAWEMEDRDLTSSRAANWSRARQCPPMDLPIDVGSMQWEFPGELYYWRGPSPYHFIRVPEDAATEIRAVSPLVTYGWGVIPVNVRIGESDFSTSLFPKDGGYFVPIKDAVRQAEGLVLGDPVMVEMAIRT